MPKKNELKKNVVEPDKKTTKKKTTDTKSTSKIKVTTTAKTTRSKASEDKKNSIKKESNIKKTNTKKLDETKKIPVKRTTTKKVPVKNTITKKEDVKNGREVKSEKTKDTVVKRKIEKLDNLEEKEKQIKEKIDEVTVIEKIKNFLSKIIAMQEENIEGVDKKIKEKNVVSQQDKKIKSDYLLEYYDLPYRYNETVVKILAQTPKRLFVYWDISDKDREKYIKIFGDDFFYKTYPVLLLYNEDKKYIQEIPINDFANSWYIDIQDSKSKYTIQLGRKFIGEPQIANMSVFEEEKIILRTDYLPLADSNKLEVPNDHVLLKNLPQFITFRNIKTNQETTRDLGRLKDTFGATYNIKEFYRTEYKEELSEEGTFDMANPSSALSSSSFK